MFVKVPDIVLCMWQVGNVDACYRSSIGTLYDTLMSKKKKKKSFYFYLYFYSIYICLSIKYSIKLHLK